MPHILRTRFMWRFVVVILLLFVLTLLSGYTANFYAYHKAQNLLFEVRMLEAGKTTVEDANRIVQRFGGEEYDARSYYGYEGSYAKYVWPDPCLGEDLSYAINVSPPGAFLRAIEKIPALQLLGWHSWNVGLMIHRKNGKVMCYSQIVWFTRPDGQEVEAQADLKQRRPQSLVEEQPYEAISFISRGQYHKTRVSVLPEASAEEKTRAFQMDLSCTISLRGCFFPCQIIPLGWLDSVRDRQLHSSELPEGGNDPRCPVH
jgi:hypothetical protein